MYKTILREFKTSDALFKTIATMNRLESESLKDKNFINFVKNTFEKRDDLLTIFTVHNWVYSNFTYIDDDYDETIVSPRVEFQLRIGDCDDYALFTKTVLKALGVDTRYILLGKEKNIFSHIAVAYKIKDLYIYIDSTVKKLGALPNRYKSLKII